MSTFKELIQKILTEAIDLPPAIHQSYQHQFSSQFTNYIKNVENGIRKGFDKKRNLWLPHTSVEGGSPTIGYGHKIQHGENFSKGITEDEAIKLLNHDLEIARNRTRTEIDQQYGHGLFDHLPLQSQEMLTDFMFNLGTLKSFPKFTRAVLINDTPTMMREYKRFVGGKELGHRNQEFYNRYLANRVFSPTKKPAV